MNSICFLIDNLVAGGSQKVLFLYAKHLLSNGHNCTVLTFSSSKPHLKIPRGLNHISLYDFFKLSSLPRHFALDFIFLYLFLLINRPKLLISFITRTNILAIVASRFLFLKVFISERNDPSRQNKNIFFAFLSLITYPFASVVTANSCGAIDTLSKFPFCTPVFLPNPVENIEIPVSSLSNTRKKSVLSCSRLVPQKRIDLLVKAFSISILPSLGWTLDIVGSGPSYNSLVSLASSLDCRSNIIFHGFSKNTASFYSTSSIFCLCSEYEGVSNSLLEAIINRIPVIVSSSQPGSLSLIRNKYSGLVFYNYSVNEVASLLNNYINHPELRKLYASNSFQKLVESGYFESYEVFDSIVYKLINLK